MMPAPFLEISYIVMHHGKTEQVQRTTKLDLTSSFTYMATNIHVSALSPSASSPLQAETFGLLLAMKLADILQVQDPIFYLLR
jgi:hypothetical protein